MKAKRLMRGVGAVTASAVLVSTLGMSSETATAEPADTGQVTSFTSLSDKKLWESIEEADRRAVIGLKAPYQDAGFADGKVLVDDRQRERATNHVLSRKGVSLVAADDVQPTITVEFESASALRTMRRSAFVDWVEPASFEGHFASDPAGSMGCNGNDWNWNPAGGDVYTGSFDRDGEDWVPINFRANKVREAWGRGGVMGAGATVGVVDTGTFPDQTQITQSGANRRVTLVGTYDPNDWRDACNHGTRMVSTVGAPRDNSSMVGVAPKANLVSVKANDDVVVAYFETDKYRDAIRLAVAQGARIVAMAFGTGSWEFQNIKQEIQMHTANGVLFVGAAGTGYCSEGVIFPAKMPEVLAVTATVNDRLAPNVCSGPEVDLHADIGQTFALGKRPGDRLTWGGSSAATAVVSGVAALVASKYPGMSGSQIRDRLSNTATRGTCSGQCGGSNGRVNAYAAVGGFERLGIGGPRVAAPGERYTLTASPVGDGPFAYRWSTGATTKSISATAGPAGTSQTFTVSVTDTFENKTLSQTATVTSEYATDPEPIDPCLNVKYCQ